MRAGHLTRRRIMPVFGTSIPFINATFSGGGFAGGCLYPPPKGNMKRLLKFLMGALVATSIMAHSAPLELVDASLESGMEGAKGTVESGWFTFAPSINEARSGEILDGTLFFDAMDPLDGAKGAFLVSHDEFDGASMYQAVALSNGVTYRLTVAVGTNGEVPKSDAKFSLVFFDTEFTNQLSATEGVITAGGNSFSDYHVEWTPSRTDIYHVGMRNLGYVPGTSADNDESAVFFDHVRLEAIPGPSATIGMIPFAGVGLLILLCWWTVKGGLIKGAR